MRNVFRVIDQVVDWISQGLAAVLVAAEIIILFAGVVGRYAFDHPLVWSDEIAGILFLWLLSLGAVIALRRGEHMRMTVIANRFGPRAQRLAACFGALLVVVVSLGLIVPGLSYAAQQQAFLTPGRSAGSSPRSCCCSTWHCASCSPRRTGWTSPWCLDSGPSSGPVSLAWRRNSTTWAITIC
jgi:TRAP-type C4-dicarboxylate transport system permease small subunit